ncbi:hypothetical protein M3J09_002797 [Ascochyta lentis]
MPPKATAHKTYSADVVAAVLMATGTTSLSMKHYEVMSSLDGVKTASAFQHDFRDVLAKAKELKARIDEGEVFEPVQPTKKRGMYGVFCIWSSFTFTIAHLSQPTLTCHTRPGSYKVLPSSGLPISLTPLSTLLLNAPLVQLHLSISLHPTLLIFSQHGQSHRLPCWRSEGDLSGFCLCPAHGTGLHGYLQGSA